MKFRKKAKNPKRSRISADADSGILVRPCHGIAEFEACVRVEREVWKSSEIDVVPVPLFAVASETGGQVFGAFRGTELIGFTMAIAGWRGGRPFLHSHMTAVLDGYRDRGVGRRLKLFQREDALARGMGLVEWTFDPLVPKNAYFNFMKLGAIARRYLPNVYGITTSPLHGSLPTDRLVAEWHLQSARVRGILSGKPSDAPTSKKAVRITIPSNLEILRSSDPEQTKAVQSKVRTQFLKWFGSGFAATAIQRTQDGFDYVLEPWSKT